MNLLLMEFMETIIGLKDFRAEAGKIIDKVAQGQSFVVVRRSKPVFRISPVDEEANWETLIDFTKIKKGGVPIEEIVAAIKNERTTKSHRKAIQRT